MILSIVLLILSITLPGLASSCVRSGLMMAFSPKGSMRTSMSVPIFVGSPSKCTAPDSLRWIWMLRAWNVLMCLLLFSVLAKRSNPTFAASMILRAP